MVSLSQKAASLLFEKPPASGMWPLLGIPYRSRDHEGVSRGRQPCRDRVRAHDQKSGAAENGEVQPWPDLATGELRSRLPRRCLPVLFARRTAPRVTRGVMDAELATTLWRPGPGGE